MIGAVIEFVLDMAAGGGFFGIGGGTTGQSRTHPRYGIPRERVRAMKRTGQGRAELKRLRKG